MSPQRERPRERELDFATEVRELARASRQRLWLTGHDGMVLESPPEPRPVAALSIRCHRS